MNKNALFIRKIMRITIMIYFLVMVFFQMLLAGESNGQVLTKKMTVTFQDVSLYDAIVQLQKEQNIDVIFDESRLGLRTKFVEKLALKNTSLNEILRTLFNGQDISFKEIDKNAVVLFERQQPGRISGRVTDKQGQPLPAANIRVVELNKTTSTNNDGYFSINVTPGTYTLEVTYLAYQTQRTGTVIVTAGKEEEVNIVMEGQEGKLNEVVVVAYGEQQRREITGSLAKIDASSFSDMPVGQFSQQLQGKVAGVQISQVNGQPGRGMAFRIRGAASLSAGSDPLFVIDGLPITGDINNINPAEIESFTILKDASATALYGSRASNGVVLITTKQAKEGEAHISLNSYFGLQSIPENKVPKMMNAREYAQYMKDRYEDAVKYEKNVAPLNPVYENPEQYGEGTNWFDVVTRTAPTQNYDLSVLSSKEHSKSAVVAGYQSQEGVLVNTKTELFSLRVNNEYNFIHDRLHLGFNVAPSYRIDHNNRLTTDGLTGIFLFALEASPLGKPVEDDGSYPYNVNSPGMVTNVNPYAQLMARREDYKTTRILGNGYANFRIIDGLWVKTNIGVDKGAEIFDGFAPSILSSNGIATGRSASYDNYSWTAEANLQYTKTFKNHTIEALVGYSGQRYDSYNNAVAGQDFIRDDVPYLGAAASITSGSTNASQYSLVSAIGRLNYSYKGRYLLSGSFRNDGSSRFGENKKYGTFPSIAAGWVMSEEPFMQSLSEISFLKWRISYGITGNNNIGNYTYIPTIGSNLNYYANGAIYQGATVIGLGNRDLAWERNKQLDIGLDLQLMNGRIGIVYDYYHRNTDGMIQTRPIPRSSGFSSIQYNTGQFKFWGHELTVQANILNNALKWNTSLNLSIDRNEIVSLVSPGYIDYRPNGTGNYFRNQVGHPLGQFYGYVFEGLYQNEDDLAQSAKYQGGSVFSDVGTIKFKDLNNDGVVEDVNDRTFIGNPTPDFLYGMTHELRYKQVDFSVSISGQVGGDILNVTKSTHLVNIDGARNLLAEASDRWRSTSDPGSGIYPRTETNTTAVGRYANTQWVEKGTYLTVNNISLGYTFALKNKAGKSNSLRVFGTAQRPLVFTKYTGMNPEANLTGLDATQGIGVDVSSYPIPKTFALGLSINFM